MDILVFNTPNELFQIMANIKQLVAFKYMIRRLAAPFVLKNHSLYIGHYLEKRVGYIENQYTQLPRNIFLRGCFQIMLIYNGSVWFIGQYTTTRGF